MRARNLILKRSLQRMGRRFAMAVLLQGLLLGTVSLSTAQDSEEDVLCELWINGTGVESLVLEDQQTHNMITLESPGESVQLPEGEYRIHCASLEGGYELPSYSRSDGSSFHLRPDEPYELTVGGPLQPTVIAHRSGRSVNLSYGLVDQVGRSYVSSPDNANGPPRFNVYLNKPGRPDEEIGDGVFEYG